MTKAYPDIIIMDNIYNVYFIPFPFNLLVNNFSRLIGSKYYYSKLLEWRLVKRFSLLYLALLVPSLEKRLHGLPANSKTYSRK